MSNNDDYNDGYVSGYGTGEYDPSRPGSFDGAMANSLDKQNAARSAQIREKYRQQAELEKLRKGKSKQKRKTSKPAKKGGVLNFFGAIAFFIVCIAVFSDGDNKNETNDYNRDNTADIGTQAQQISEVQRTYNNPPQAKSSTSNEIIPEAIGKSEEPEEYSLFRESDYQFYKRPTSDIVMLKMKDFISEDDFFWLNQYHHGIKDFEHYKRMVARVNINVRKGSPNGFTLLIYAINRNYNPVTLKHSYTSSLTQEEADRAITYLLDNGADISMSYEGYNITTKQKLYFRPVYYLISSYKDHTDKYLDFSRCMDEALFRRIIPAGGLTNEEKTDLADTRCGRTYNLQGM